MCFKLLLKKCGYINSIYLLLIFTQESFSADFPIQETDQIFQPTHSNMGMVASQEMLASKIGAKILKQGGNAIDAAVAVGYTLAVTFPKAGNIGGGGFMIIWLNDLKKSVAINYRETAPGKAHKNMFLDSNGNVDKNKATLSTQSSGIPGTVYGLNLALEKYGSMTLSQVMQPAIDLAENGIKVSYALASSLKEKSQHLQANSESAKIFYKKNKGYYKPNEILFQKDLAKTLKLISKEGTKAFYNGSIAKKIVKDDNSRGGIMTLNDFTEYKAEILKPIITNYRGFKILSMPPPSSGGVILSEMLNILENYDFNKIPLGSAQYYHILSEAMNFAYYDRNTKLGDPNFVKNPIKQLTDKSYAHTLFKKINLNKHTASTFIQNEGPKNELNQDGNTTHYSIIDKKGNIVSNTYTLNLLYGNGITIKGTGILMNNELDDFTTKIGVPNSFGLLQGKQNSISPKKRPLSSMTPTIVLTKNNEPLLATGAPGGSRITTQVLLLLNLYIDYKKNIATASSLPRFHRQLWPDKFHYEEGISPDTLQILKQMGHDIELVMPYGSLQTVEKINSHLFKGSSDPRSNGAGASGAWIRNKFCG